MAEGQYHHGDLRAALLAQAEVTLRQSGVDGLSLRELARAVGVSHGAPRRHFQDKAALLDALVAEGLHRLGRVLDAAADVGHGDFGDALRAVALAYVRFATENPPLIELMSRGIYLAYASQELIAAREMSFVPVRKLVEGGQATGRLVGGDVRRQGTLIFATLHGLATMANNGMIDPNDEDLVIEAVNSLVAGLRPADPRHS